MAKKELIKRSISGILFAGILIFAAQNRITFLALILIFGLITLLEFNRLIKQKNPFSYLIFIFIFFVFGLLDLIIKMPNGINEVSQIIHVISLFVLLFLIGLKSATAAAHIAISTGKHFFTASNISFAEIIFFILISFLEER